MPSERVHRLVASDSESTAQRLLEISPTWSTVVSFYAGLHWVDAFLAHELDMHPQHHAQRSQFVQRSAVLLRIYSEYERLFTASLQARYHGIRFSRPEAAVLVTHDLSEIKTIVIATIGD